MKNTPLFANKPSPTQSDVLLLFIFSRIFSQPWVDVNTLLHLMVDLAAPSLRSLGQEHLENQTLELQTQVTVPQNHLRHLTHAGET